MQKVLVPFFRDFRNDIKKSSYRKKIVTIVLFGSSVRDSFVKGQSDIDIITVVKERKDISKVNSYIRSLIKRLNKKHKLGLEKTLSDEKKYHNPVMNTILKIESTFLWGVPLYVISKKDFDLVKFEIRDKKIIFLMTFIGSLQTFFINLKYNSRIIYGRNLLKHIHPVFSWTDRIKMAIQPYYLILLSLAVLMFSPKFSVKHAMKACLMESEFDLILLNKKLKSYKADRKIYEKVFSLSRKNIRHLKKVLYYREKYEKIRINKNRAFKFILDSIAFISHSHGMMLRKAVKKK